MTKINLDELRADREAGTDGPWHEAYDDDNGQAVVSGEHTEICTCWHHSVGSIEKQMHANARRIARLPDLEAAYIEAVETLRVANDAITEMFHYYDGGETRGSYDGRPERDGLRKAGYKTRATLAKL